MIMLIHRRHTPELGNFVMLFAEVDDSYEANKSYGPYCWHLETDFPLATDSEELIEFAMDYYSVDRDEAIELIRRITNNNDKK